MRNSLYHREIEELADELDDLRERQENAEDPDISDVNGEPFEPLDEDEKERLKALDRLETDLNGDIHRFARDCGVLIHENDFAEHAEEEADSCGLIDSKLRNSWPFTCIDWERAADMLKADYDTLEWEGETYYFSSNY